jgi:hypothetical protein
LYVEKYPGLTYQPASIKLFSTDLRLLTQNTKFPSGMKQTAAEIPK